jgi:hypothetical protein
MPDDCADEYTACEVWKEHGHCESQRFAPFLDTYCEKSCDACDVHRRMSFWDAGNENETMEALKVDTMEVPDAYARSLPQPPRKGFLQKAAWRSQ